MGSLPRKIHIYKTSNPSLQNDAPFPKSKHSKQSKSINDTIPKPGPFVDMLIHTCSHNCFSKKNRLGQEPILNLPHLKGTKLGEERTMSPSQRQQNGEPMTLTWGGGELGDIDKSQVLPSLNR